MLRSISVAVIAVMVLGACASGPFKKNKRADPLAEPDGLSDGAMEFEGLLPARETRFPDVPLPTGLKEDIERSFVYESRELQIGRMIYNTKHSTNDMAQFYIREAPKYNWILESVLQAEGVNLLFQKPGKRMWINVRPSGMTKGGSQLIINLTPAEPAGQGISRVSPL